VEILVPFGTPFFRGRDEQGMLFRVDLELRSKDVPPEDLNVVPTSDAVPGDGVGILEISLLTMHFVVDI
jgi:hypothetical protein